MCYHTPELLLVGGAQNLVLEPATGTSNFQGQSCFRDNTADVLSDTHELWQVMERPSDVELDGRSMIATM